MAVGFAVGGRPRPRASPRAARPGIVRRAAEGSAGGSATGKKGEVVWNYLTNNYDYAQEGAPMPWEDGPGSWTDFLPWSDADREALQLLERGVPNWRRAYLTPSDEAGVRRRFRAIADAAGGEAAGLQALERNIGVMCVSERVTRAASAALVAGLGAEAAADVVRKNPGVLAIRASDLRGDGLQRTAAVANVIDFLVGPGKVLVTLVQFLLAISFGKAFFDVIFLPNGIGRAFSG